MSYLARARIEDLRCVAVEMGITENTENLVVLELKKLIERNENYVEQDVKELLKTAVERRKEEAEERKRKEEAEERKRKEEAEERKRKEDNEFQLEKMRLENERIRQGQSPELYVKPQFDLHKILQKFDPKTNDVSLYLVLFERQAARAEIKKENWVSHLIGLLPYDVAQIIARENSEVSEDYDKTKELLLKRYKLTPEKFRQMFTKHYKRPEITWCDFAYELRNYFNKWIRGLGVKTFEDLSDLIITDQIKRKVPPDIRDHFIDSWSQFKVPDEIVSRLDDYENVRVGINRRTRDLFEKEKLTNTLERQSFNRDRNGKEDFSDRKYVLPQFRDQQFKSDKKEYSQYNKPKVAKDCYICGDQSHFSRDCPNRYDKQALKKENTEDVLTAKVNSVFLNHEENQLSMNPLQFENILVDGKILKTLVDTGTEVAIVNSKRFKKDIRKIGQIVLTSTFGGKVYSQLGKFQMALPCENGVIHPTEIIAAFTDKIQVDCILPKTIFELIPDRSEEKIDSATPDTANGSESLYLNWLFQEEKEITTKIQGHPSILESHTGSEAIIDISCLFQEKEKSQYHDDSTQNEKSSIQKLNVCLELERKNMLTGKGILAEVMNHEDKILNETVTHLTSSLEGIGKTKHRLLFTGNIKIAEIGEHKIRITKETRKKPYVYGVPKVMKSSVDTKINELLDLIEERNEEIAYPIMCVNKGEGRIMCVDYRSSKFISKTDNFPTEVATPLLRLHRVINEYPTLIYPGPTLTGYAAEAKRSFEGKSTGIDGFGDKCGERSTRCVWKHETIRQL